MDPVGTILHGQQFDPKTVRSFPFTEQVVGYNGEDDNRLTGKEGTSNTDIQPMDRAAAKVRQYDVTAIQTMLDAEMLQFVDLVDLSADIPPILKGLVITYNEAKGDGANTHSVTTPVGQPAPEVPPPGGVDPVAGYDQGTFFSGSGSLSLTPRSSAQSSASVMPDLQEEIEVKFARRVPASVFLFYMPSPMTLAHLIDKLNTALGLVTPATVLPWPKWNPVAHTITVKGQQVAIRQEADTTANLQVSNGTQFSGSFQRGRGHSYDTGLSTKTVRLPPTIHGLIKVKTAAGVEVAAPYEVPISVNVVANTMALLATGVVGAVTVPAIYNDPPALPGKAVGSAAPLTLDPTTPHAAVPTSGLYLYDVQTQAGDWDRMIVRAVVVDFAYFAP